MWFRVVPKDVPGRGGKTVYIIQMRPTLRAKWTAYASTTDEEHANRICRLLNADHTVRITVS